MISALFVYNTFMIVLMSEAITPFLLKRHMSEVGINDGQFYIRSLFLFYIL